MKQGQWIKCEVTNCDSYVWLKNKCQKHYNKMNYKKLYDAGRIKGRGGNTRYKKQNMHNKNTCKIIGCGTCDMTITKQQVASL